MTAKKILCFGEMLLRLNPPEGELLMQGNTLTVRPGGAEANVAVSLARFGAPVAAATVLPENALGYGVRDELRKHGVDTSGVEFRPGRMGLYFMTPGAVRRPADVLYDRAGSAFVQHVDTALDWPALLGRRGVAARLGRDARGRPDRHPRGYPGRRCG
jgi:2-dehydro-3-deoxygluconokinase